MSGSNPFMRAWYYLEYHPEPERVVFGLAAVGLLAIFFALAWFVFRRPRRAYRVQRFGSGVFVVGATSSAIWHPSYDAIQNEEALVDPMKIATPNPINGDIRKGSWYDYDPTPPCA